MQKYLQKVCENQIRKVARFQDQYIYKYFIYSTMFIPCSVIVLIQLKMVPHLQFCILITCCQLSLTYNFSSVQFSLVAQSSLTSCDPMDCSTPGLAVHHQLPEFTQTHAIESVMPSNHLILCRPLLPPSIFPRIRVFSNESVLCIRWPKYWNFIFSISPSDKYSHFRINLPMST